MGKIIKAVVLGQVLSLLSTGTAFSSTLLVRQNINAPTSQLFLNYLLLAVVNGFLLIRRLEPLKMRWYLYILLAFIDVEANYLATKAYHHTSITSVMLLDCWSIPCVLLLTWFLLNTRYLRGHLVGVSFCVLGLVLVLLSDVHAGGSNVLLGDSLVLLAATLYACANVFEEFLVKQVDRVELLAVVGCFGALISGCQVALLERRELEARQWSASGILPFLAFAGCLFLFATLVPQLLQIGGSAMLNLSLLTSDMYAITIRLVLFHQSVDWLYFVAFVTVIVGIIYYSTSGEPPSAYGGIDINHSKGITYKLVETSPMDSASDNMMSHDLSQSLCVSSSNLVQSPDEGSHITPVVEFG